MNEQNSQQINGPIQNLKSKNGWIIIISVVITALIVGGGVFVWQRNVEKGGVKNLESEIQELRSQLSQLQSQKTEEEINKKNDKKEEGGLVYKDGIKYFYLKDGIKLFYEEDGKKNWVLYYTEGSNGKVKLLEDISMCRSGIAPPEFYVTSNPSIVLLKTVCGDMGSSDVGYYLINIENLKITAIYVGHNPSESSFRVMNDDIEYKFRYIVLNDEDNILTSNCEEGKKYYIADLTLNDKPLNLIETQKESECVMGNFGTLLKPEPSFNFEVSKIAYDLFLLEFNFSGTWNEDVQGKWDTNYILDFRTEEVREYNANSDNTIKRIKLID